MTLSTKLRSLEWYKRETELIRVVFALVRRALIEEKREYLAKAPAFGRVVQST